MNRLTRQEAANYLGCSRYTIYRLEKEGLFDLGDYYDVGVRRFYITEKLDAWMAAGGESGARQRKQRGRG